MAECKEYFYPNGNLRMVICKNDNGRYHNKNGPAYEYYDEYGKLKTERYIVNNQYHRINGPAIRHRRDNGVFTRRWFINDKNYTFEVEKWLKDNNIETDELDELVTDDYHRMWFELL